MFHCRTFTSEVFDATTGTFASSTRRLLVSDMRVDCDAGSTIAWMALLGAPMVLCLALGIPTLLAALLWRRVGKPHSHGRKPATAARFTLGFLYGTCT